MQRTKAAVAYAFDEPLMLRAALVGPAGCRRRVARQGRTVIDCSAARAAQSLSGRRVRLIKRAALVRLVTFIDSERQRPAALVAGSNLMSSLERHGIHATLDIYATGENTAGDHLLSRVVDEGCDLLIMGCYGHSRLREMIFGGVSQKILAETWVPTLMSH